MFKTVCHILTNFKNREFFPPYYTNTNNVLGKSKLQLWDAAHSRLPRWLHACWHWCVLMLLYIFNTKAAGDVTASETLVKKPILVQHHMNPASSHMFALIHWCFGLGAEPKTRSVHQKSVHPSSLMPSQGQMNLTNRNFTFLSDVSTRPDWLTDFSMLCHRVRICLIMNWPTSSGDKTRKRGIEGPHSIDVMQLDHIVSEKCRIIKLPDIITKRKMLLRIEDFQDEKIWESEIFMSWWR